MYYLARSFLALENFIGKLHIKKENILGYWFCYLWITPDGSVVYGLGSMGSPWAGPLWAWWAGFQWSSSWTSFCRSWGPQLHQYIFFLSQHGGVMSWLIVVLAPDSNLATRFFIIQIHHVYTTGQNISTKLIPLVMLVDCSLLLLNILPWNFIFYHAKKCESISSPEVFYPLVISRNHSPHCEDT